MRSYPKLLACIASGLLLAACGPSAPTTGADGGAPSAATVAPAQPTLPVTAPAGPPKGPTAAPAPGAGAPMPAHADAPQPEARAPEPVAPAPAQVDGVTPKEVGPKARTTRLTPRPHIETADFAARRWSEALPMQCRLATPAGAAPGAAAPVWTNALAAGARPSLGVAMDPTGRIDATLALADSVAQFTLVPGAPAPDTSRIAGTDAGAAMKPLVVADRVARLGFVGGAARFDAAAGTRSGLPMAPDRADGTAGADESKTVIIARDVAVARTPAGWMAVGFVSALSCPDTHEFDLGKQQCVFEGLRNAPNERYPAGIENRLVAWISQPTGIGTVDLLELAAQRDASATPGTNPPETLDLVTTQDGVVALWRAMGALYALPLGFDGAWLVPPASDGTAARDGTAADGAAPESPRPQAIAFGDMSPPSVAVIDGYVAVLYAKRPKPKAPFELRLVTYDIATQKASRSIVLAGAAPGSAAPGASGSMASFEAPALTFAQGRVMVSWLAVDATETAVVSGVGRSIDEAVAGATVLAKVPGHGQRLAQTWDGARAGLAWLVGPDKKTMKAQGMAALVCDRALEVPDPPPGTPGPTPTGTPGPTPAPAGTQGTPGTPTTP